MLPSTVAATPQAESSYPGAVHPWTGARASRTSGIDDHAAGEGRYSVPFEQRQSGAVWRTVVLSEMRSAVTAAARKARE